MKLLSSKTGIAILVIVFVLPVVAVLWYNYEHDYRKLPYYSFNMERGEYMDYVQPTEHVVSDFNFVNQLEEKVNRASLGECIYVVDYIFTTCPGICKTMSSEMTRVYAAFKDDPHVKILSHTAKPEEDSISVLVNYAERHGVKDPHKWMFLTGSQKELKRMALEQYGIVNPDDISEEGSFVHTEMFVLVDNDNNIRGYYDGTNQKEVTQMIDDMKELLKEQF